MHDITEQAAHVLFGQHGGLCVGGQPGGSWDVHGISQTAGKAVCARTSREDPGMSLDPLDCLDTCRQHCMDIPCWLMWK